MTPDERTGGYSADKRYIDETIAKLQDEVNELREMVTQLRIQVGGLIAKASVWGALAATGTTLLVSYLIQKLGGSP